MFTTKKTSVREAAKQEVPHELPEQRYALFLSTDYYGE
jgi:hypothetical protein